MNVKKLHDVWSRFAGKGVYPHELAFLLDSPLRKLILPARRLVDRLHLSSDSLVLEIGPGPGYFSAEVVRRIPGGTLILFDIQREMLSKSRAKLGRTGHQNFHLVQGSADSLPFSASTFDVVFLVTVLGEVKNPANCIANIADVLRPGGMLSLTEQTWDPDALEEAELLRMAETEDMSFMELSTFRGGFTLNLMKRQSEI